MAADVVEVACASGTSLGTAPGGALAAVPEGFASARALAEDAPVCGVEAALADGAAAAGVEAAAPGLLAADEGGALPDAPRAAGRSGIAGADAPGAAGAACRC